MTEEKCPRCGHTLTRRKYARTPTYHTTNRAHDPNGTACLNCRDCYQIRLAEIARERSE